MRAAERCYLSGQVSLEQTSPTDRQIETGPAGKNQTGLMGHSHSSITKAPGNLLEALMLPDRNETKPK